MSAFLLQRGKHPSNGRIPTVVVKEALFVARGSLTFKQTDVTRLLKAAEKAGHHAPRVEITKDGKLVLVLNEAASQPASSTEEDWEKALANDR